MTSSAVRVTLVAVSTASASTYLGKGIGALDTTVLLTHNVNVGSGAREKNSDCSITTVVAAPTVMTATPTSIHLSGMALLSGQLLWYTLNVRVCSLWGRCVSRPQLALNRPSHRVKVLAQAVVYQLTLDNYTLSP